MCGCLTHPLLGTWPAIQASSLTWNEVSDLVIRRLAVKPLSHTTLGSVPFLVTNLSTATSRVFVLQSCVFKDPSAAFAPTELEQY